jgi:alpha-ketoglutarate-dependent taurine dioxygenase
MPVRKMPVRKMPVQVIPSGAAIGAEIRGVNLAQEFDDATFTAVENAYNAHGVIF